MLAYQGLGRRVPIFVIYGLCLILLACLLDLFCRILASSLSRARSSAITALQPGQFLLLLKPDTLWLLGLWAQDLLPFPLSPEGLPRLLILAKVLDGFWGRRLLAVSAFECLLTFGLEHHLSLPTISAVHV